MAPEALPPRGGAAVRSPKPRSEAVRCAVVVDRTDGRERGGEWQLVGAVAGAACRVARPKRWKYECSVLKMSIKDILQPETYR